MPYRIMLTRLTAAVTVVALFAAVSVPVSAQAVKTQPAQKVQPTIMQPTQPAQPRNARSTRLAALTAPVAAT